ncbi:hypothetical protein MPL3365_230155 [Mesorhizobium plurifarium]|uniref:Acetate kinase n=1 Tax=Mesorhizobium plurifarium TaxID=69974 RepID=A0A090GUG2_MESPL|nr:hypothetical protein MPL3365_230155 [Mesorhizobium plurifarium]
MLYERSGLLGVSGISGNMQTLLASKDAAATRAVDLFVYRIGREIGSLAAAIGGLDTLVFTAGIGEHAPVIRQRICETVGWLGVALDKELNANSDELVSTGDSPVDVLVIAADEERAVAAELLDFEAGRLRQPPTGGRPLHAGVVDRGGWSSVRGVAIRPPATSLQDPVAGALQRFTVSRKRRNVLSLCFYAIPGGRLRRSRRT